MADDWQNRAAEAFLDRRYDDAKGFYTQAIKKDWGLSAKLFAYRARANHELGEDKAALDDIDRAILMDPTSVMAYICKGEILMKSEQYGEAEEALKKGLSYGKAEAGTVKKQLETMITTCSRRKEGEPNLEMFDFAGISVADVIYERKELVGQLGRLEKLFAEACVTLLEKKDDNNLDDTPGVRMGRLYQSLTHLLKGTTQEEEQYLDYLEHEIEEAIKEESDAIEEVQILGQQVGILQERIRRFDHNMAIYLKQRAGIDP